MESAIFTALLSASFKSLTDIAIFNGHTTYRRGVIESAAIYNGIRYRIVTFTDRGDNYRELRARFDYISTYESSPFAEILFLGEELLVEGGEVDLFLIRDDYSPTSKANGTINNVMRWIECSPITISDLSMEQLGEDSCGRAVITAIDTINMEVNTDGKEVEGSSYEIEGNYLDGYFCSDRYLTVGSWCEGRLVMADQQSGLMGIISDSQRLVAEFAYSDITDYYECLAAVELDGRWGVINRSGDFVITAEYDDIELMWEVNHIKYSFDGLFGLFARDLSIICDAIYRYIGSFSSGMAIVKLADGGHNYIDIYGDIMSDKRFLECEPFIDGLARVKDGDRWITIDRNGQELATLTE